MDKIDVIINTAGALKIGIRAIGIEYKRIFEEMGHRVIKLKREKYAFLELEEMPVGSYRTLTKNEVERLYNLKKNK